MTVRSSSGSHVQIFRIATLEKGADQRSVAEHAVGLFKRSCPPVDLNNRAFWFKYIPGLRWLSSYNCSCSLYGDLTAGLATGVMAVPQTVSFASMAGLPAAFGLYGCFSPIFAYALFGGSRHLAVGPVALISLLLGDSLSKLVPGSESNPNPNQPGDPAAQQAYNRAAIQISLLVGIIYCVLCVARLGYLCNLLSRPIISSFLTAGAIIISMSQAKYILGIHSMPMGNQLHMVVFNLARRLPRVRWQEMCMGCAWLAVLYAFRKAPRLHRALSPFASLGPISVAAISIALVWGAELHERAGILVVGRIQPGLPSPTVSWWFQMESPLRLAGSAGAICLVGLLEAISIAKALAEKYGDRVDAATELRGLAAANLLGAAFGAYPVTGSFARSAISSDAGGVTGLNNVIVAFVVGCTLIWLTPVFEHMPMNAMAAIVIMGVLGLLDFKRASFYWKVSGKDFTVWMATFLASLFIGIDIGLAVGVGVALAFLFSSLAAMGVQPLVKVPHTDDYRYAAEVAHYFGKQEPRRNYHSTELEVFCYKPQVLPQDANLESVQVADCGDAELEVAKEPLIVRPEGSLCFANAQTVRDQVAQLIYPPAEDQEKLEISIEAGSTDEENAAFLDQSPEAGPNASLPAVPDAEAASKPVCFGQCTQAVVLDMSAIEFMDATAAEVLLEAAKVWKREGIGLALAGPKPQVLHICERAGLLEVIGRSNIFWRVHDAFTAACQPGADPD